MQRIYLNKLKSIYHRFRRIKTKFLNLIFGTKNYKKFVIISRSRTGSTLLMALLDNHPNIICEGELFKVLNGKSCKKIWQGLFINKPKKIKQVGFKLFYYHPFDEDKEVWDLVKREKNITIIHLVRQNMLKAYVSQRIGEKTKQWTENVKRPHNFSLASKKVDLNYKECLDTFTQINNYEKNTRERFSGYNFVEVSYESLINDKEDVMKSIFEALDVPYKMTETVMKKQNPEKLEDLINNYSKLKNKFKNSQFELFFE